MTKKKPTQGFFFRNVVFDAFDSCASLQSRDFQAGITIDDDARRCDYQGKEKCVFAHFEQRIEPGCGDFDAESRITGVRPEFTHSPAARSGTADMRSVGNCSGCLGRGPFESLAASVCRCQEIPEIQPCPIPGVVTRRFRGTLRKRRYPFPGIAAGAIEAHGNL